MSEFKQTGSLVFIGEIVLRGEKQFATQEFAIEIEGRYPEFPAFQLTQDRCGLIGRFKVGDKITAYFDLRGREWQGKYFTNLNCWRIDPADGEPHQAAPPAAAPATSAGGDLSANIDWNAPLPEVPAQGAGVVVNSGTIHLGGQEMPFVSVGNVSPLEDDPDSLPF